MSFIHVPTSGEHEDLAVHGSMGIAQLCVGEQGKLAREVAASKGAIGMLVEQLRNPRFDNKPAVLEAAAHALLNLSASPDNQIIIARRGMYTLVNLGRTCVLDNPRLWFNISATLANCTMHFANRAQFYKAELEAKLLDAGLRDKSPKPGVHRPSKRPHTSKPRLNRSVQRAKVGIESILNYGSSSTR